MTIPTTNRKREFEDTLLKDFTDLQKEFIINEVYPSLKQALMHFVQKSIQSQLFDQKMKKLEQVQMATDFSSQEVAQIQISSKMENKTTSVFSGGFSMAPKEPAAAGAPQSSFSSFKMPN